MQPNYYGNYPYQQQPMGYQQNQNIAFNRPNVVFALVKSSQEVQDFIVYPNQTVYLLDEENQSLFVKKADLQGKYLPLVSYILSKPENESNGYVKQSDFLALQTQINSLTQLVNGMVQNSNQNVVKE